MIIVVISTLANSLTINRRRLATIILVVSLIGLSLPAATQAQPPSPYFNRLSLEQGLSHGTVFSIVQDQTGFIWFGTPSGLNKYDGYNITVFKSDPKNPNSLSNDNAGNLYIDRQGIIWIGTWGGGLNRLDPRTGQFTTYSNDPANPASLSSDRVQTIFQDRSGTIWVGTSGGGLNKLNAADNTFTRYQNNPANPASLSNDRIWAITQDADGYLWVATSDQLNRFDPRTETFTRYPNLPPTNLKSNEIRTLYLDKTGQLWIGSEAGLTRLDPRTETFTHYQNDPTDPTSLSDNTVNAILQDHTGTFWVGTRKGGLSRFDPQSSLFTAYKNNPNDSTSLSYNDVRGIYEDRSGIIWVGTRGGGVNKFNPSSENFVRLTADPNAPNSLNNNDIWAIYQDPQNHLWLGTKGGGLNRLDPQTGQFTAYRSTPDDPTSLSSNDVYAIWPDPAGVLWLGLSGGGLNKFDPQTGAVTRYQNNPNDPTSLSTDDINVIYQDRSGQLWLGTKGGGLNQFDPSTGQATRYKHNPDDPTSLGNNDVYAILEDHSGHLWVGTYGGGLNLLDRASGQFTRYQYDPANPTSLSNNDIYSLYEDNEGALWIATANGGLNKLVLASETASPNATPAPGSPAVQFVRFGQAEGLISNVVYGILPDEEGNLWLSTSKGLSRFNPSNQTFTNYDASDGLGSAVFHEGAYQRSHTGEMFFGGINGLVRFYPQDIGSNPVPPGVILTSLTVPDRPEPPLNPIDQLRELQLTYPENNFSFEFAALDFTSPVKNRYAYMLEGFDQDWIEAGLRRFATYTNLDPGQYLLRIKGANNAGVWNEAAPLKITVTPPFWETWWFRIIAAAAVLGLVFAVYTARVASIQANRRQLKILVDQRTAELSIANQNLQTLTNRLQTELNLAREIQQSLLPPARPNWSNIDIVCYNNPATEVGGDFYAYHTFNTPGHGNGQKFGIAVGDVSGKGMPAALLMAVSLASFQSVIDQALSPAQLLRQLDEAIMRYTRTRTGFLQNCALSYLELAPSGDGGVTVLMAANAGCVAPLIRRADGALTWVDIGGMPLGIGLGMQDGYNETALNLSPGDVIILTSDGVVEAKNETGEMYGFDRLEKLITNGPTSEAQAMLDHIRLGVMGHVGNKELHDDVTIVVLRV